eukprot:1192851-Prorocentrum_minimum.AAC.2
MADPPRASSPGPSQMRWEHLDVMYLGGADDLLFLAVLQLVAGELPVEARRWFGGARLVALLNDRDGNTGQPIPVAHEGGVRPIARGEEARQFRAHFCRDAEGGELAAITQVGVAMAGGVDRVVHQTLALLEAHPDWVVEKVDAKNAFNCLSRRVTMAAVRRHFPHLFAFTRLCYADPPPLFFQVERGHVHIWSEQGTQQGDPLGCFYRFLQLHEVLGDLRREHPDVVITAYVDDVFLIGPPAAVQPAYHDLVRQMRARLSLASQARKCAVYSPMGDVSMFPADMPGVSVRTDGIEILGIPIGSDDHMRVATLRRVR